MTQRVTRIPFEPAEIGRVLAFCRAHSASRLPEPLRRRLLTDLTSSARSVIELRGAGGGSLLGVVVDGVQGAGVRPPLELLGARESDALPSYVQIAS